MTDGITFTFGMETPAIEGIRELLARLVDPEPALDEIGASVVTETQMRFEAARDPSGAAWQKLSETTIAKRRAGSASRILWETGDNLYDTLSHKVDASSVLVGVNRAWAVIHQFGGKAGRGKRTTIPARPFLGLSPEGAQEVLAILRDHVEGK